MSTPDLPAAPHFKDLEIEQVRKRGLPPLLAERGQTPLPDLFICLAPLSPIREDQQLQPLLNFSLTT
jgi:hypothetical protein